MFYDIAYVKNALYICKRQNHTSMTDEKDRLLAIMKGEGLSAKQFAEEVGIQPGTVSNILSGRNKPSLEVMQKVLKRYDNIASDWLISGNEPMYRQKNDSQTTLFDSQNNQTNVLGQFGQLPVNEEKRPQEIPATVLQKIDLTREIQKIVVFYNDGTFEEFTR